MLFRVFSFTSDPWNTSSGIVQGHGQVPSQLVALNWLPVFMNPYRRIHLLLAAIRWHCFMFQMSRQPIRVAKPPQPRTQRFSQRFVLKIASTYLTLIERKYMMCVLYMFLLPCWGLIKVCVSSITTQEPPRCEFGNLTTTLSNSRSPLPYFLLIHQHRRAM